VPVRARPAAAIVRHIATRQCPPTQIGVRAPSVARPRPVRRSATATPPHTCPRSPCRIRGPTPHYVRLLPPPPPIPPNHRAALAGVSAGAPRRSCILACPCATSCLQVLSISPSTPAHSVFPGTRRLYVPTRPRKYPPNRSLARSPTQVCYCLSAGTGPPSCRLAHATARPDHLCVRLLGCSSVSAVQSHRVLPLPGRVLEPQRCPVSDRPPQPAPLLSCACISPASLLFFHV